MSFEKNIVEFNFFAIKLSSEKILDQFFVWLLAREKITGNWKNLDVAYFWCQKSAAKLVLETNTSYSTRSVR